METKQKPIKYYYSAEVCKILGGISKTTLFSYIKKGIVEEKRNTINNYRIFTEEDVETLKKLILGTAQNETPSK